MGERGGWRGVGGSVWGFLAGVLYIVPVGITEVVTEQMLIFLSMQVMLRTLRDKI